MFTERRRYARATGAYFLSLRRSEYHGPRFEMTDSKIRIVYDGTIFTSQAAGGISRYFRRLIEEMSRLRPAWIFDVHVVDDVRPPAPLPSGENICISRRRHFRPAWCCLPLNYGSRQFQIRKAKPAILHSTLARPFHFPMCPTVITIHDAIIEKFPDFYGNRRHARAKRWWRWSANHSAAIFTVSKASRSDILDVWSLPPSRVHVTYPGIEEAFRQPRCGAASAVAASYGIEKPYILYVGHRGEHKNFQVLATAIRDSALDGLDLVLVGGADRVPELEGWPGLKRNRLHHLKRVTDSELCSLYSGAVALVLPSLCEGFGFPLVEAMSSGAPVVASDIPSSREVCGDAAEFFQPRDARDCAQAVLRILNERSRSSMIRMGMKRAELFSWSSCAEQTLRVYEELLRERPSGIKRLAA
jgi:glycosyltransferase involved in cell wall biosynthesis